MKKILLLFILLPLFTRAQNIITFAGTGAPGYFGDGGQATAALFNLPHSLGYDAAGNLFIADVSNNCIRRVSTSGIITTVAGTGTIGYSGDNGPATAAKLNQPFTAQVNAAGYLFIGDNLNHAVRMVDPSGIITTIAGNGTAGFAGDGGPATAARFDQATGIAIDASGNVYIGDQFNDRVRKIDMSTGIITTIAGTGFGSPSAGGYSGDGGPATLARLYYPNYLHFDNAGNLYITDNGNHAIRKVTPAGIITTVAGNGLAGHTGDGGQATNARLNYPGGITIDVAGNMYIADDINNCVRKVNSFGVISTFAGNTTAGYSGDGGPATAAELYTVTDVGLYNTGNLLIADFHNNRIREISPCLTSIFGSTSVCPGATITLSSTTAGGAWVSSNTTIATAGVGTGIITGVSAGSFVIDYTSPTGCFASGTITVLPPPPAITGITNVCVGSTTTLSDAAAGTWSSGSSGIATVSSGGIVTGASPGAGIITYTSSGNACFITTSVTVFAAPTFIPPDSVCVGSAITLFSSPTGGTWSSSNTDASIISASPPALVGIAAGTSLITYTVAGGCTTTTTVTINPLPQNITGITSVCTGLTTTLSDAASGGTWSSGSSGIATITANTGVVTGVSGGVASITYALGTGCSITTSVTVYTTPGLIAADSVCAGSVVTFSGSPTGGTWSSSNTDATITPGPAGGGVVTGVAGGNSLITYSLAGGCTTTTTVTVNPLPQNITGVTNVCTGLTTTLSDATPGGTWSSGLSGIATVTPGTGIVTGVSAGVVNISYTLGTGCLVTTSVIVYTTPAPIAADSVCAGSVVTLIGSPTGGTWSSSNTDAAITPGPAGGGIVTGVSAGTSLITYSLAGGCTTTTTVTVNPLPQNITGITNVCTGLTTTLSDATLSGTWTSGATGIATVTPVGGVITGVSSGVANITYTLGTGCFVTTSVTVYTTPSAIAPFNICMGAVITLSDSPTGGTWGSSNTAATITPGPAGGGVVTPVGSGTAEITYSVTGGCIATTTVTVNPLPQSITGITNVCTGLTTTLSDATLSGTWTSGSGGVATVTSSGGVVRGVSGGVVNITYTLGTGCFTSTSVTVYTSPAAIAPFNICMGTVITLSDSPTGGTWSSSNTAAAITPGPVGGGVITPVGPGTSEITYSVTGGCVTTTTVTVNSLPQGITGTTNVCTGLITTLSDATLSGTWTSGNAGIATVTSGGGAVKGVSGGVVNITYTLNTGCLTTTSVTVYTTPATIAPFNICMGSVITLSDSPAGGTWSSSNTAATITPGPAGGGVVTPVGPGTSAITYSVTGGCATTTTVTVNPLPQGVTGITNVCTGLTTTLSDATVSGTWTSGVAGIATVTLGGGVVRGVSGGIVNITYTLSTGCFATTSVTVYTTPAPIAAFSMCTGTAITLSDSPTGGTWSSDNTAAAITTGPIGGGVVSAAAPGTATITYSVTGGCIVTTTVTVNQAPAAITSALNACIGLRDTLGESLTGGVWSSATSSVATIDPASGILTGVATGGTLISYAKNGCTITASVSVNIVPSVSTGSTNICTDGGIVLSSAPGGGVWSSSNTNVATVIATGIAGGTVTGMAPGVTTITYLLSGCFATTTVNAFASIPAISGPAQVCSGQSIALSNAITDGTWSSGNTTIATVVADTGIVSGVSGGNVDIIYSIGGSCITTATVTVILTPDGGVISGAASLCIGATIMLSDTASGGVWSISNTTTAISGVSVTGVAPGFDTVSYILNNGSCADTTVKVVTIYALPDAGAIAGPAVVCVNASITLSDPVAGGTWSSVFPVVATVTASGGIVTGLSAGIDTIKYVVSNPGCTDTARHAVTVYNLPDAGEITGRDIVCRYAVFTLSDPVNGGVWSSSNTTVATVNNSGSVYASGQGATTITYSVGPGPGGCSNEVTFTVTVNTTFTIDSSVTQIKCYGDNNGSISITISGGSPLYSWSNGNTTPSITNLAPGQYILNVSEPATQCAVTDTFNISSPDSLNIVAEITKDLCKRGIGSIGTTVTGGVPGYLYLWSDNSTGTGLQNLHAGTYTVTVTDANKCIKILPIDVEEDTCSDIVVHNAVTPNGDGINDVWVIEGIENYPANTVQIFDKWGDMIYQKSNYSNDWGGNGKNGPLPDGTYYYLVKLNTQNGAGGKNTFTGYLLIKR